MITFIFLGFVGMFAIAGTFISIEAKQSRAAAHRNEDTSMGRATPDHDEQDLAA